MSDNVWWRITTEVRAPVHVWLYSFPPGSGDAWWSLAPSVCKGSKFSSSLKAMQWLWCKKSAGLAAWNRPLPPSSLMFPHCSPVCTVEESWEAQGGWLLWAGEQCLPAWVVFLFPWGWQLTLPLPAGAHPHVHCAGQCINPNLYLEYRA